MTEIALHMLTAGAVAFGVGLVIGIIIEGHLRRLDIDQRVAKMLESTRGGDQDE